MTFLQHLGKVFKKVLGITVEVAKDTEPEVDLALTAAGLSGLVGMYNGAVGLAVGAETMAPSLTGTGPQKLSQLLTTLEPQAIKWAADNNINWPVDQIKKWSSAVVDTINLIPAPLVSPNPSPRSPIGSPTATPISIPQVQTQTVTLIPGVAQQ